MRLLARLESRSGALAAAVVAHALLLLVPVLPRDGRKPQEYIQFELTELEPPVEEAVEPEPEPEPEPEAPAGELIDEPERDPTRTSVESNREDDATPDEEVPLVTGVPLTPDQLAPEGAGMAVAVGNTFESGHENPGLAPEELQGFAGGGRGGGGSSAGVQVTDEAKVLRAFDPVYPRELVSQQIEGLVVVRVEILANGRVGEVQTLRVDHPLFLASVKRALRRYRFRPARLHGEKVSTTVALRFRFQLSDLE